ncbi:adenosylcobinamide amidohydrolase [Salisediminibacterium halotolerans]|uniref:Iron complex transport system ATP-binding protein n=1 Tax=Salisediminibacterium halotolerans TaxID=517425 RepID=A0A1H9UMC7_9BACI|nr:adenosylcobinamide amidohydrolase [Salisediminibacterium haloalkalitolerans]SES10499.1 iron complex transport system ATP-binding protein [Salisediminibacterium haloalkalitolerans]
MIELKNVTGGYPGVPVIEAVNLTIRQGEFFALLGPNGSGKTTLFKLITGTLSADEGEIFLGGQALSSLSKLEKARKVAVLSQETHVSFDFTVEEIVALGRYAFQTGIMKSLSQEDRRVIEEVMALTDVAQYRDKPFQTISGGEKQRVLLAKALAQQPSIFLLDEPTNHLDIKHAFHILDLLKKWQRQQGTTVFAILHDLNVASLYADRAALMKDGRIAEVGDVSMLKKELLLQDVYDVKVKAQAHPDVAKPQLLMAPREEKTDRSDDFHAGASVHTEKGLIHITFDKPLRTIADGVIGAGIQWLEHFCNFHVPKHYDPADPAEDMKTWLAHRGIPQEKALVMVTAVDLADAVFQTKTISGVEVMVMVTAGTENAVDITYEGRDRPVRQTGTINLMVFLNRSLSDGALVSAAMSAAEGKTKAVIDCAVTDRFSGTPATGTSTDSLVIGASQTGEKMTDAGSGTAAGHAIGRAVYEAVCEAVHRSYKREVDG